MNIAVISAGILPVPALKGGAVEILTQNIIEGFIKNKNNNVDVYTIKDKGLENSKYQEKMNIYQFEFNKFEYMICRCVNYIFKMLKKNINIFPYNIKVANKLNKKEYDLIIVENSIYLYKNIYDKYFKRREKKAKIVLHLHNMIDKESLKGIETFKFVCKTADKILTVSKFLKKQCLDVCHSNNIEVLYNCVDFNLFNADNNHKLLNKEIKIKKNSVIYMYTGRINKDKGILELVKAFNRLNKKYKDIELIIVGSKKFGENVIDEYFTSLKNEIMSDNIHFTGYVDSKEIPNILLISDIVVIPSMWEEVFGVVALEAMAMKKPTITTNSGGLIEVVDTNCSIVIERNENIIDNLYYAMEKMYLNPELRREYGENGYNRCHSIKEFDKDNYFDNFFKLIDLERGIKDENK